MSNFMTPPVGGGGIMAESARVRSSHADQAAEPEALVALVELLLEDDPLDDVVAGVLGELELPESDELFAPLSTLGVVAVSAFAPDDALVVSAFESRESFR
jgi:hypothetical protein